MLCYARFPGPAGSTMRIYDFTRNEGLLVTVGTEEVGTATTTLNPKRFVLIDCMPRTDGRTSIRSPQEGIDFSFKPGVRAQHTYMLCI